MSLPIVMTCGEPAGIGPDIALALWEARERLTVPPFVLLGDPHHLRDRASALRLNVAVDGADADFARALPVLPLVNRLRAEAGRAEEADAAGVVEAIDRAARMACAGEARAMVTLPINKHALYATGFDHPGHTEFLAALARTHLSLAVEPRPVMMIAGPELRTVPVTIHEPLADVPRSLRRDAIVETIRITARDLSARFHVPAPRIAVAGLNPHAGEGGTIGREDEEVVRPAVEAVRAEGIDAFGPLPADTMFHPAARASYDAAVCMYHDQALIPAKTLAFDEGVNVTLGLPFVRTSPDHGTAFDIAGTARARVDSTLAALRMADGMTR